MVMTRQSTRIWIGLTALAMLSTPVAFAQKWEVGGGGGASFYNSRPVNTSVASVDAGFKTGFAGTGYFGQNGDLIGGEVRYSYQKNDMQLKSGSTSYSMGGYTQAFHYDVLIYAAKKAARVRPYGLVGGGVKEYVGTGPDVAIQPLGDVVVLTRTTDWKPLLTFGGGVKFYASQHFVVRAEFLVQMTPVPQNVITPVTGKIDGWYMNYLPIFTVAYTW